MQDYVIADHRIRIEGDALTAAVNKIGGFEVFWVQPEGEPLATITSRDTDAMIVPAFAEEQYSFLFDGVRSVFGTTSQGYRFEMTLENGEPQTLWCDRDCRTIYLRGQLQGDAMTIRLVRFSLWIAYGMATSQLDTIAIHTSTITYRGRNVLFLGESGTGKSTHTRLWRENIPGATLLNDDSPILRIIDGEAWIYGSPWSGKTPCFKNERYPLAACVRLSQAPENKIRKLRLIEAYAAIHPSCPPAFAYDEYLYDGISRTLGQLLQRVPFYHLACLPDAEAAQLSCSTVFGE